MRAGTEIASGRVNGTTAAMRFQDGQIATVGRIPGVPAGGYELDVGSQNAFDPQRSIVLATCETSGAFFASVERVAPTVFRVRTYNGAAYGALADCDFAFYVGGFTGNP